MEERYLKTSSITSVQLSEESQTLLHKIRELVIELSPSTKIVLSLRHDKSNINGKINRGKEIIKHFCKTNKLDLKDNLNIKDKKLYLRKSLFK